MIQMFWSGCIDQKERNCKQKQRAEANKKSRKR